MSLHEPIKNLGHYPFYFALNNDSDFTTQGWPGSGSKIDPYVIEGYEINGTGYGYCLYIGNTTKHFVVRNNYLHHADTEGDLKQYYFNTGLYLHNVQNGKVENNMITDNDFIGIYLEMSDNNVISNNTASYAGDYGILMYDANNNEIINNTLNANDQGCTSGGGCGLGGHGIALSSSSDNLISHNNASWKNAQGIKIEWNSNGNIISNNSLSYNTVYGMAMDNSNDNEIYGNNLSHNNKGMLISRSNNNNITENILRSNDEMAIYLDRAVENTFRDNGLEDQGMIFNDFYIEHWNTHDIDDSNTVNGKPIIYWKNQNDGILPSGAGQIILANCTGVVIEDQDINEIDRGIQIGFSDENIIRANHLSGNDIGVYSYTSNDNTIYHNNFIDNVNHVQDDGTNIWDDSWPNGGNYWSDHTGGDDLFGPNQDKTGNDGIIDESYDISGIDEIDRYPLIAQEASYLYLEITDPVDGDIFGIDNITVSWDSFSRFTDYTRYEIRQNEGDWTDVGIVFGFELDVPDGNNVVEIKGYDENEESIVKEVSFIVDTTPPVLNIIDPIENDVLTNDTVTVEWTVSDAVSGMDRVNISLNGEDWIDVGTDTDHEFADIGEGEHVFEIIAWDVLGHNSSDSVTFYVNLTSEDDDIPEEGEDNESDDGQNDDTDDEVPDDGQNNTQDDEIPDDGQNNTQDDEVPGDGQNDDLDDESSNVDTEETTPLFGNTWAWLLILVIASSVVAMLLYFKKERFFEDHSDDEGSLETDDET